MTDDITMAQQKVHDASEKVREVEAMLELDQAIADLMMAGR